MEGAAACSLARVGACADELRLMGVERAEVSTLVGRVGGVLVPSPRRRRGHVGLLLWIGCGAVPEGTVRIARRKAWLVAGVGSRAAALL